MVSKNYFLLIKTADAEKRAWKNLAPERRSKITPVLELTRGKKIRGAGKDANGNSLTAEQLLNSPGIYGFERSYSAILDLMGDCEHFFVDLTREPSLKCKELEDLGSSKNGYERWTSLVLEKKEAHAGLLPSLLINPADDETEEQYIENITKQFNALSANFPAIAYRVSILDDEEFLIDLETLKSEIEAFQSNGGEFFIFIDHEYIRPNNGLVHAKRTSGIITAIKTLLPKAKVVTFATSFPKAVTDIGDEEQGRFRLEEMFLFKEIKAKHADVLYGDYGSINPIRNDEVIITQGWRPRIDFISREKEMSTYYFREKRDVIGQETIVVKEKEKKKNILAPYSKHYASVARDVISNHPYYENLVPSWGNSEIIAASNNKVPSNSPSHWISVRMEVHVVQVLKQFGIDPL